LKLIAEMLDAPRIVTRKMRVEVQAVGLHVVIAAVSAARGR
jgi:hypothetical protein